MSPLHKRIKSIQGMGINLKDKTYPLEKRSSGKDRNRASHSQQEYEWPIEDSGQRDDFVSRVYRDTGFICEI